MGGIHGKNQNGCAHPLPGPGKGELKPTIGIMTCIYLLCWREGQMGVLGGQEGNFSRGEERSS